MLTKLNKKRAGFTLVEIMIVVAIIALLAAIAVPNLLRARKRSQATRVLEDLRLIDSAIDQYAIESNRATGDTRSAREYAMATTAAATPRWRPWRISTFTSQATSTPSAPPTISWPP